MGSSFDLVVIDIVWWSIGTLVSVLLCNVLVYIFVVVKHSIQVHNFGCTNTLWSLNSKCIPLHSPNTNVPSYIPCLPILFLVSTAEWPTNVIFSPALIISPSFHSVFFFTFQLSSIPSNPHPPPTPTPALHTHPVIHSDSFLKPNQPPRITRYSLSCSKHQGNRCLCMTITEMEEM